MIVNNQNCTLREINCFGWHKGPVQGICGWARSCAHWSTKFDERTLKEYYVEHVKPMTRPLHGYEYKGLGLDVFFAHLNLLKDTFDLEKINNRHIVRILEDFGQSDLLLSDVFSLYQKMTASSTEVTIDAFIAAAKAVLANGDQVNLENIKKAIIEQKSEAGRFDLRIKNSLYDGLIWEIACAFACYKYDVIPPLGIITSTVLFPGFTGFFIVEALTKLSASLPGFGGFFFAGVFAELTVLFLGTFLNGAWEKKSVYGGMEFFTEKTLGGLESIRETWYSRVMDDNSFHPFIEIVIGSVYIALSWLYIDKLQRAAKVGEYMYKIMEWGFKDYILKYVTMHVFFTLKAELQKDFEFWRALCEVTKASLMGIIRGIIKNPLADYSSRLQAAFRLSEALRLMQFPQIIGNAYLHSWMASVPKTIIGNPELLVNCLWVLRDAWEVIITNLSSLLGQLTMHCIENPGMTYGLIRKHLTVILVILNIGTFAYYNPQIIQNYLNS